jgi:hypothetical protein
MHWASKLANVGTLGHKHQSKPNPKGERGKSNAYLVLLGLPRTPCGGGGGGATSHFTRKSPCCRGTGARLTMEETFMVSCTVTSTGGRHMTVGGMVGGGGSGCGGGESGGAECNDSWWGT